MWVARREISQTNNYWTRPLITGWLYAVLIFAPVTVWSYYAYPAWATVYLREESLIPVWGGPIFGFYYILGMIFGTTIGQYFIQKQQIRNFWMFFILGCFWQMTAFILTKDEYFHIGTYSEYHSGTAIKIFENPEFMNAMNIMGALIAIPFIVILVSLWRRSQRISA